MGCGTFLCGCSFPSLASVQLNFVLVVVAAAATVRAQRQGYRRPRGCSHRGCAPPRRPSTWCACDAGRRDANRARCSGRWTERNDGAYDGLRTSSSRSGVQNGTVAWNDEMRWVSGCSNRRQWYLAGVRWSSNRCKSWSVGMRTAGGMRACERGTVLLRARSRLGLRARCSCSVAALLKG